MMYKHKGSTRVLTLFEEEFLQLDSSLCHLALVPLLQRRLSYCLFLYTKPEMHIQYVLQLGQAGLILRRIAELCQEAGFTPLAVFMGDFNSTPHSAIYSFMKEGELDCYMEDRRNLSGQLESEEKGWPPRGLFTPRAPPSPAQLNQRARVSLPSHTSPGPLHTRAITQKLV